MEYITKITDWTKGRLQERTTWDGVILVGAGIGYLVLEPIASFIAYGAIAYGIWTILKKESSE